MPENDPLNNIPEINKEFLSENPDIGGVINPSAMKAFKFMAPPVQPANIAPIPTHHTQPLTGDPKKPITKNTPADEQFKALSDKMGSAGKFAADPYKYGKMWGYDADYTGVFYDRYADMGSVYKKVGFSPWRDNEAIYNTEGSWLNHFSRAFRNSMSLASISFQGSLPWNAWDGQISKQDAEDQERAFAKGQDSRTGFSAFMNNQVLNSGFTVGVLGEFAAESLVEAGVGLLLTPETGGASDLIAAEEILRRGAQAANTLKKGISVERMGQRLSSTAAKFKDLNWARQFYNGIKTGQPIKALGKSLTPNVVDAYKEVGRLEATGKSLSSLAKISRGAGAFYKDVRTVNAAISESKMEAGMVEMQTRKSIETQFFKDNNRMPTAEEYSKIYTDAAEASNQTFWWNLPAIYLSNKIVLDKAFKSMRPLRSTREALSAGFKNYAIQETERGVYAAVKTGMRADLQRMFTKAAWKPSNLSKNFLTNAIKYTKANIAEGLQEQYQEAVSGAMQEYYTQKYFRPELANIRGTLGYFGENLGKQFTTAQGWETFASGFMMGGMMQGPQHIVFTKGSDLAQKLINREGYEKAKQSEVDKVNATVNSLNEISKTTSEFTKSMDENLGLQLDGNEGIHQANQDEDKYTHINIVDNDLGNHFITLAESNKMSLITDQLQDYLKMDSQELVEAFGQSKETVEDSAAAHRNTLEKLHSLADGVQKDYKDLTETFINPFNPWRYDPKKNRQEFTEEASNYRAFQMAIKAAVMARYTFGRTTERLSELYASAAENKPVDKANASDFQMLYDDDEMIQTEIDNLKKEISIYKEGTGKDKATVKERSKKLDILDRFQRARKEFMNAEEDHRNQDTMTDEEKKASLKKSDIVVGSKVIYDSKEGEKTFIVKRANSTHIYDENGVRYAKKNVKVWEKGAGFSGINDIVEDKANALYDVYTEYVKHIANKNKDVYFENKMEKSFKSFLDFLRLSKDKFEMASVINFLHNPQNVREFIVRNKQASEAAEEIRLKKSAEALLQFSEKAKNNKFLNDLMEAGAYLDDANVETLLTKGEYREVRNIAAPYAIIRPADENYQKVSAIIEAWRKENGFVKEEPVITEPVTKTETEPGTPPSSTPSRADVDILVNDLHYSIKDVESFSPEERESIIREGLIKSEKLKREAEAKAQAEEAKKSEEQQRVNVAIDNFKKKIEDITTTEELNDLRADIFEWSSENPLVSIVELDQLTTAKREALTVTTFESIKVGDYVYVSEADVKGNKTRRVEKKNKDSVEIRTLGLPNEIVETIPAEEVSTRLKKVDPKMKPKSQPVSEEVKEVSNQNVATAATMDKEKKREILEKVKSESSQKLTDDFKDSIGCE